MLEGLAVFVYDVDSSGADRTGDDHKGESTGDADAVREVDFVQELLNQVVPRKRSVKDGDKYDLLDENGYFGNTVARAVEIFKKHFKVDNTSDEKSDFKKLVKDYSLTESEWTNKIIDKKILIGKDKKLADNQINTSTADDAGLYELYDNVVKVFIQKMIGKGNEYAQDTTSFKDRSGSTRTGVSYSFGSNDSRQEYRDVATSETFAPSPYPNAEAPTEYPTTPPSKQYHDYRGDIGTLASRKQHAGLKSEEFIDWIRNHYSNCDCNCDEEDHHFFPQHWAGVDCSGFAMRIINAADPAITQNNGVPRISINIPNIAEAEYGCNANGRFYSNRLQVGDFFVSSRLKCVDLPGIGDDERTRLLKLLKKGDLIRYGNDHVSIVHSDRWGESSFNRITYPEIDYDIIHAYGITPYHGDFARKVLKTGNDITAPTGFGRIKLWD